MKCRPLEYSGCGDDVKKRLKTLHGFLGCLASHFGVRKFAHLKFVQLLGARPLDGRGFFVIKGVSWMMFYVFLPIGIGSMRFFHCLTLDLQAEVEKLAFRLGETSTFGVFTKSETNWIWHVFIPWSSNGAVGHFLFVTATFRVLPRTFVDLGCLSYNASTTWRHIVRPMGA